MQWVGLGRSKRREKNAAHTFDIEGDWQAGKRVIGKKWRIVLIKEKINR